MSSTLTADMLNNTKDNFTASDQPVAQPPTGLSAEDVQWIATAVAALVGGPSQGPSTSHNLLVSAPSQVSATPTAGTQLVTVSNHLAC